MIQIKDIDFRYPGSKHLVFRDFSLELKENNIYGLYIARPQFLFVTYLIISRYMKTQT